MFNGNEGSVITLAQAEDFTQNYANTVSGSAVKGIMFGKNHIEDILAQEDCVGIRSYFAIVAAGGELTQVWVGVDANEDDLENGIVLETAIPCPPICSSGRLPKGKAKG